MRPALVVARGKSIFPHDLVQPLPGGSGGVGRQQPHAKQEKERRHGRVAERAVAVGEPGNRKIWRIQWIGLISVPAYANTVFRWNLPWRFAGHGSRALSFAGTGVGLRH